MEKSLYKILGVSKDIEQDKIKTAAQSKIDEIKKAYTVLGNPEKRKAYDAKLETQEPGISEDQQTEKKVKCEKVKKKPLANISTIGNTIQKRIGPLTVEIIRNDEIMTNTLKNVYPFLPMPMRILLNEDAFFKLCLENREKFIQFAEQNN